MTAKFIYAFAPPTPNLSPRGGCNGSKGPKPVRQIKPLRPHQKGLWVWIRNQGHRLLCWVLALIATRLASVTYGLSRIGFLNQRQTCWLLRYATRVHGKSVRMLIGGSW